MDAGRLNKWITIQRMVKTRAPSGQTTERWEDVCKVWADMVCTDSKAADTDGVIIHEGLYRFRIRYRRGLDAEMRVLYRDGDRERVFPLVGPPADWEGNRAGLTLICKELG